MSTAELEPNVRTELRAALDDIREHDLAPAAPETVAALLELRRYRARLTTEAVALDPAVDAVELRLGVDRAIALRGPEATAEEALRLVQIARMHASEVEADHLDNEARLRDHREMADKLFVGWMLMHDPRQFPPAQFETLCADLRARAEEAAALRRAY